MQLHYSQTKSVTVTNNFSLSFIDVNTANINYLSSFSDIYIKSIQMDLWLKRKLFYV